MSHISTAPRAAFNELSHSLVCRRCPSAAYAWVVAPVPLGHSRSQLGQRGARGTQLLLGGAREGQEEGGLPLFCVLL